jgi:hypothetical protein
MALSDLKVYSEYVYTSLTEVLRQQVDLFNAASEGTIILGQAAVQGDYSDSVFWANVAGLVRRRNAYGTGTVSEKVMSDLVDTMVKIAAGTPPVRLDPGQFRWIQKNPQEAGAAMGQQIAVQVMADMLNTSLGAGFSALGQISNVTYDNTGATAPADKLSFAVLNNGQAKFGDQSAQIRAWVMHSKPMFDLYGNALTNAERLFLYGSVNVTRDPFGKLLIMTDAPNLVVSGSPNVYAVLGLVPGALRALQGNDFDANEQTINGSENIIRTYQAEWSWTLGVKGFSWDKTNGGKSPADAALFTATNWDRYATSDKDLAGVLIKVH